MSSQTLQWQQGVKEPSSYSDSISGPHLAQCPDCIRPSTYSIPAWGRASPAGRAQVGVINTGCRERGQEDLL